MEIIEVPDEKAPEKLSDAEMLQVKEKEGQRILGKINDNEYVFVLAINGKQLSSEEFSKEIEQLGISGKSNLTFVIGGSLGLSDSVLQRSNQQISFWPLDLSTSVNAFGISGTNLSRFSDYERGTVS